MIYVLLVSLAYAPMRITSPGRIILLLRSLGLSWRILVTEVPVFAAMCDSVSPLRTR